MGVFSSWSYTARCTVWEPQLDEFGQPTIYTRTIYPCSFVVGGDLMQDSVGVEFMPKTTIYLEAEDASAPQEGSFVITSESTDDTPPAAAEIIRKVTKHDPSLFNEGTPDRVLVTG